MESFGLWTFGNDRCGLFLDGLVQHERPTETEAHPPTLVNSEIGVFSITSGVPVRFEELIKGCQADRPFCAGCVLESGPPASFDDLFFNMIAVRDPGFCF
jgi:hypothetical protein